MEPMTTPRLDHATLGDREWTLVGCWHEWNHARVEWEPSAPPPAEAHFYNYRDYILGLRNG
jgi:hypothetical protein